MTNDPLSPENATNAAITINVLGMLAAAWLTFYPVPYLLAAVSAMVLATAYLAMVIAYKGLIKFNTTSLAFIACSMVMMIRAGFDFEIVEYKNVWIYVSMLSLLTLVLLVAFSKEFTLKTAQGRTIIISSALFITFYSFGLYVFANCLFDRSEHKVTWTTIAEMKITRGTKSTTYHWYLSPWGPNKEVDHVIVSEAQYGVAHVGDSVELQLRPGFLGTQWYRASIP